MSKIFKSSLALIATLLIPTTTAFASANETSKYFLNSQKFQTLTPITIGPNLASALFDPTKDNGFQIKIIDVSLYQPSIPNISIKEFIKGNSFQRFHVYDRHKILHCLYRDIYQSRRLFSQKHGWVLKTYLPSGPGPMLSAYNPTAK